MAQSDSGQETDTKENIDNQESKNANGGEESGKVDGPSSAQESKDTQKEDGQDDPIWKSCDFSKKENKLIKKNKGKECRKKDSCKKIKECLSDFISIKNEADIKNDSNSSANTGENIISPDEDSAGIDYPIEETATEENPKEKNESEDVTEINPESGNEDESGDNISPQNEPPGEPSGINDPDPEISGGEGKEAFEDTAKNGIDPNSQKEASDSASTDQAVLKDEASEEKDNISINSDQITENENNPLDKKTAQSVPTVTEENDQEIGTSATDNEKSAPVDKEINSPEEEDENIESIPAVTEENDSETETSASAEKSDAENEDMPNSIETDDAAAENSVYNEINTNVVGENVEKFEQNITGMYSGDINLLDEFTNLLSSADTADSNGLTAAQIAIENTAETENSLESSATTGGNSIEGEDSRAAIETGDAISAANIVNFINVNLIGENWLFATINVFGDWVGDLIVPGEGLLNVPEASAQSNENISIENDATIINTADANASTGSNTISGDNGTAAIETGSAASSSVIKNVVNTTIIKNSWFFLTINNMGSWIGKAIHWGEDNNEEIYSYDFNEDESWEANLTNWFSSIFIKNSANIENSAVASASTGSNSIKGNYGAANIQTGSAYAASNIYNFVNTSIIGNNWFFATVNIFGTWKGNVNFAYPDLSVSINDGKGSANRGENLHYSVEIENEGKASASNVYVRISLPDCLSTSGNPNTGDKNGSGNEISWNLSGLGAGEKKSFSIDAAVPENISPDESKIRTYAQVLTETKETELDNNTSADDTLINPSVEDNNEISPPEIITLNDNPNKIQGSQVNDPQTNDPQAQYSLSIRREINNKKAKPGEKIKYTIYVSNSGDGDLHKVKVEDNLKNKDGDLGSYAWDIGNLGKGKTAKVTYGLLIGADAPKGDYKSSAVATGFDPNESEVKSSEAKVSFHMESVKLAAAQQQYYYYYYLYSPAYSRQVQPFSIIETASAAENNEDTHPRVLGAWTNRKSALPLTYWLIAALSYSYLLNSFLFPKKKTKQHT
ncbi:MAG: CARDB domain-containing protein [Parcubacteria group bacterium]